MLASTIRGLKGSVRLAPTIAGLTRQRAYGGDPQSLLHCPFKRT